MIDTAAALAAIDRVGRIEWRHDPTHLGSQAALMKEYLRRSAICAEALGRTADWPWYDAAARLTLPGADTRLLPGYVFLDPAPEYRGPGADPLEDQIIALHQRVQRSGQVNAWMKPTYLWYIRWESVRNQPALTALGLPDLYEPLIAMYERGGRFRPEQGYLDLDGTNVTVTGWRQAAQQTPLPSRDSRDLDRLDVLNQLDVAERKSP